MMNKTKSGIPAKLKATLVIPVAMIIFFLFADFTMKAPANSLLETGDELTGLWVKQGKDNFSNTLYIHKDRFSFSKGLEVRDYFMKAGKEALVLSDRREGKGISLKYRIEGAELILWWNDSQKSRYTRSESKNTLDNLISHMDMELDLPHISRYRLLDEERIFRICYGLDPRGGTALTFNGKPFTLIDLEKLVEGEKEKLNKLDQGSLTAMFLIDKSTPMILVNQIRGELQRINALHIAEGGYPHGEVDLSPILYNSVALPRLLPPKGAKVLDKKEVEKRGGNIYTINLSARNTTPGDVDQGLREFIGKSENGKYVISLEYDGAIPYGQYIESVDMIFNVVYEFREKLALDNYQAPYEKLGDDLQRVIRKAYPMALSESHSEN